jgi:hypothetical protein
MPRVVVNNPYSTTNKQSSAGIVNNPYKKSTQQQKHQQQHSRVENGINRQQSHQLQFPQYPQQQHQHQYNLLPTQGNPTSMGNYRPGSSNNAASSHNEVVRHRKQLQMTSVRPSSSTPNSLPGQRNASSSSTSTTGNYRQASLPFKE